MLWWWKFSEADRSGLQLLRWRMQRTSAVFLLPVTPEASGPSQCWGCLCPESWCCYPGLVLHLFFKISETTLFSVSWDCNSWNQNCIFHKYIILPAISIQDNTRLLIPLSSWYCHVESVLCYSLPWISQGSKQDPGLHFLLPKDPRGSCTAAVLQFSRLSGLFPSAAA